MCNETTYKSFYNNDNMLIIISQHSAERVSDYLSYLFWDTSTVFIAKNGMPTNEDTLLYIEIISNREDLTEDQKNKIIKDCNDYIG